MPIQYLGIFFVIFCLLFEAVILLISLILGIIWATKWLLTKYKKKNNTKIAPTGDRKAGGTRNNNALQFAWVLCKENHQGAENKERKRRKNLVKKGNGEINLAKELGDKVRPLVFELKSITEGLRPSGSTRLMDKRSFQIDIDFIDILEIAQEATTFV